MLLGVPFVMGFQSTSSVMGECMVHVYEYMMMLMVFIMSSLVGMYYVGITWFLHYESKDMVEVWFANGNFFVGQVNWKMLNLLKSVKFMEKQNNLSKIFNFLQCLFYGSSFLATFHVNSLWAWLAFNHKYIKGKFSAAALKKSEEDFFFENPVLATVEDLVDFFWDCLWFHNYMKFYFLKLCTPYVVWSFGLFKTNVFRHKVFCSKERQYLFDFWESSSVVQSSMSNDVVFVKDYLSVHILETEGYPERNMNAYWYCCAKTGNVSLESLWAFAPGLPLLMIWFPTVYLVYGQNEAVELMYSVKVVGKQWFWIYDILFFKEKESAVLPLSFHNLVFKGLPHYDAKMLPPIWSMLESLDVNHIKFKSKLMQNKLLIVGQLRLLEVDSWLCLRANQEIQVLVSGLDVIHSFGVQGLGCKMDAVPGSVHGIVVFLKREGTFYGQCSELCGMNHGYMPIVVEVGKNLTMNNFFYGFQSI